MKILKIILLILLGIILLSFIAIFVFIKTFDANKYLPQINKQLSQTLHRNVAIKYAHLDMNTKGVGLTLTNLSISEDSKFGQKDFLTIENIRIGLDIWALLKKQVRVTDVIINTPNLSVIKLADGQINAQALVPQSDTPPPTPGQVAAPTTQSELPAPTAKPMEVPDLTVKLLRIQKAKVSYVDQNPALPMQVTLENINFNIDNFSLKTPFNFSGDIKLFSEQEANIKFSGKAAVEATTSSARLSQIRVTSNLKQLDINQIKAALPSFKDLPGWPQEIKGNFDLSIPDVLISAKGLEKITLNGELKDGYVRVKELLSPIEKINVGFESDLKDFTIKELKANIGAGEIHGSLTIKELLSLPSYQFQMHFQYVKVEDLVDQTNWPGTLKGLAEGSFKGQGSSFDPQAMLRNLSGDGFVKLSDAKIEKLNILETILSKLNFIPGLSGVIEGALSPSIKEKLNTTTTLLTKGETKIQVKDSLIAINDAVIDSAIFSITAQGTVDFELNTDISLNTIIAADLSAELTRKAKPLQGLYDNQNRLFIPGQLSGKAPAIEYLPQIDYITKKVLTAEGTEQISKQLDKVLEKNPEVKTMLDSILGGNKTQDSTNLTNETTNTEDANAPVENEGSSSKKLINNVLNIFK